ncbi:MAG TPA: DotA/TraY family protein, partial [Micavibrio sp.]
LIPIANGLNASQYIVMYAAKWGSGFATNGWEIFLAEATSSGSTLLGDVKTLVAVPNAPPVNTLLEFATILATCKVGEASDVNPRDVNGYVVFPQQTGPASRADLDGLSYADALDRSNYGDIHYVFGVYEENAGNPVHTGYVANVRPVCGELVLKVTDVDDANSPGSAYILEQYHRLVQLIWLDIATPSDDPYCDEFGDSVPLRAMGYSFANYYVQKNLRWTAADAPVDHDPTYPIATANQLGNLRECYQSDIDQIIAEGMNRQFDSPIWTQMLDYNWAGAGIWYNHVARLNGTMMAAANSMPVVRKYPEWMEFVGAQRAMHKQSGTGPERYNPELANGKSITFSPPKGGALAMAMYKAQRAWDGSYSNAPAGGASPFLDAINAIFGTRGLFELSKNVDIHPLAGLVVMGKNLMDAAIQNLAASAAAGLAGGLANFFKDIEPLGKVLVTASSAALQVAMLAMTIGFVLFYVLPFMPFLYFFFAVGSWVKGLFEAMVGVPLWALAHLRIDEEGGMSGEAAKGGYFMILEIFLRPILIIFGLLAGITIFGAQVKILNEVWDLVVSNVTGFNATTAKTIAAGESGSLTYYRGLVDRFFYTIMYAIVVYMMGMASFKLVDVLPGTIMRWISQEGGAFSDHDQSAVDGIMTKMSLGAGSATNALGSAGGQLHNGLEGMLARSAAARKAQNTGGGN